MDPKKTIIQLRSCLTKIVNAVVKIMFQIKSCTKEAIITPIKLMGVFYVKKHLVVLSLILMVGLLVACSSNSNNESGNELEVSKQESEAQKISSKNDETIIEKNWELSPEFIHFVEYESGEKGSYEIRGNKDGMGITGPFPIIAKDSQKYMWFYFGAENIYDKPVKIKAIKKGEEDSIEVYSGTFFESAEVSPESVNMPSRLRFPSTGTWKVLVYIEEELFDTIIVKVE